MSRVFKLRVEPAVGEPLTQSIDEDPLLVGRSSDLDLQKPLPCGTTPTG